MCRADSSFGAGGRPFGVLKRALRLVLPAVCPPFGAVRFYFIFSVEE